MICGLYYFHGGLLLAVLIILYKIYDKVYGFHPDKLREKRVLITGASRGIGEQLAYHYARFGAKIVITGRQRGDLRKVCKNCKTFGANDIRIVVADMQIKEERTVLLQKVEELFGGLDYLILNHAFYEFRIWEGSEENFNTFQKMIETNVLAYVQLASEALRMLKQSQGAIGVVSSMSGHIPFINFASYAACKFALNGFFGGFRQDLTLQNFNVSVTVAILGAIATKNAAELQVKAGFRSAAASPASTALSIIKGVTVRSALIYYPWYMQLLVGVHNIMPIWTETLLSKYVHYRLNR